MKRDDIIFKAKNAKIDFLNENAEDNFIDHLVALSINFIIHNALIPALEIQTVMAEQSSGGDAE